MYPRTGGLATIKPTTKHVNADTANTYSGCGDRLDAARSDLLAVEGVAIAENVNAKEAHSPTLEIV